LRIYKATRGVTTIPGGALTEEYLVEVRTVWKAPAASSGSTSGMRRERRPGALRTLGAAAAVRSTSVVRATHGLHII